VKRKRAKKKRKPCPFSTPPIKLKNGDSEKKVETNIDHKRKRKRGKKENFFFQMKKIEKSEVVTIKKETFVNS
jgi:hypothetical protein